MGERIFKLIDEQLRLNNRVAVDFHDLKLIVSTFLHAAVGQLYYSYKGDFLKDHLSFKNISRDDAETLKKVIDRAKEYFKDRSGFDSVFNSYFPADE